MANIDSTMKPGGKSVLKALVFVKTQTKLAKWVIYFIF
jgi:hypothetical protein